MTPKKMADGYVSGIWLAVLAAFGYSFKAILVKLAYGVSQNIPVDAVTLLTLRMLFALPFFLWFKWFSKNTGQAISGRDNFIILFLGVLGYYLASLFDFWGLRFISAGLERIILFTYPILTLFFGALFYKRKISYYEWGAAIVCYSGIALAFIHDLDRASQQSDIWLGGGLVIGSAICYALYIAGGGPFIARYGSVRFASSALIVSCLATVIHFAVTNQLASLVQPWQVYALALFMSLFSTVIPVFALAAAIKRIGSAPAALIGSLGPIMTIGFGWWLLNESISTMQIGGAFLVVAGALIVSNGGRKKAATHPISCAAEETPK